MIGYLTDLKLYDMNKIRACILFIIFIAMSVTVSQAQSSSTKKLLRHVVMFKFKDSSTPDDVSRVEKEFKALSSKITTIKDFEWGKNSSPENLNQGLTHCFLVTFSSDKDRDAYLTHPAHLAFVEVLKPHLDKVTVIDYWAMQ
jgi:hypothetical protein